MSDAGEQRGLVLVQTGTGKGKTTAAYGQALRVVGHGHQVFMVTFMKGPRTYGEIEAVRRHLPQITVAQAGLPGFVRNRKPTLPEIEAAREGLARAREAMLSGRYRMVILDEINVAVSWGLIAESEIMDLLAARPPAVHLMLTGRNAPRIVVEAADMVSEIKEVKHHYRRGIKAQQTIEF